MISVIASVFILIALGYVAKLTGLLKAGDAAVINKVIIYITLPAFVFQAVKTSPFSYGALWLPLIALAVSGLTLLAFWPILKALKPSRGSKGMALLAVSVGNTGYLGYPLTQRVIGRSLLPAAIYYDLFGTVLFLFTVGLVISERYGNSRPGASKLRQVLTFPGLIALAASYILRPVPLPAPLISAIGMLAGATVPLIMISIGLALRIETGFVKQLPVAAAIAFAKLIAAPAMAVALSYAVGLSHDLSRVTLLEASMPTAMLAFIVGARYGLDERLGSSAIVLTTILSMLTVPMWQAFVF